MDETCMSIEEAVTGDPALFELLLKHPRVVDAGLDASAGSGLLFREGNWRRQVLVGAPQAPLAGLIEMVDNNPLVCADVYAVPDALSTLSLIAIGPLIDAGLLLEPPVLLVSAGDHSSVEAFLARAGWPDGATIAEGEAALGSVAAVNAVARISTPDNPSELDDLYAERFGRSFFVRNADKGPWDTELATAKPYGLYRLRIAPDDGESLLTIQTMADLDGKCGAAQVLHAMNVMAGFEESLGL